MAAHKPYSDGLRQHAVALFNLVRDHHVSAAEAYRKVAEELRIGSPDTVRRWVRSQAKEGEPIVPIARRGRSVRLGRVEATNPWSCRGCCNWHGRCRYCVPCRHH